MVTANRAIFGIGLLVLLSSTETRPQGAVSGGAPTHEAEDLALEFILSQYAPGNPLPRSFLIPKDDPWYGDLVNVPLDPLRQIGTHLEIRSWIYDAALTAIALAATAADDPTRLDKAAAILRQIRIFSFRDTSQEPGTLEFSYQTEPVEGISEAGTIHNGYLRSGAIAWVGYACTFLLRTPAFSSHPDYPEILDFALEIADFIGDLQVLDPRDEFGDGSRFGSVKGGRGSYDLLDWFFQEEPVAWVSTEHNIDIYFFLRDLHHVTGRHELGLRSELVRRSLLQNHWDWDPPRQPDGQQPRVPPDPKPSEERIPRFLQGVADPFKALDLYTWGAIFLEAIGDPKTQAERLLAQVEWESFVVEQDEVTIDTDVTGHRNGLDVFDRYNGTYSGTGPFFGAKPYLEIPNDTNWTAFQYFNGFDPDELLRYPEEPPFPPWPDMIWSEGEAGRTLAVGRVRGFAEEYERLAANLRAIQALAPRGGLLYSTRTQGSLSFHAWPSIACAAWQIIALTPVERFWDADAQVTPLPDPDFVPISYGTDAERTPQGLSVGAFEKGCNDFSCQLKADEDEHALKFDYDLTDPGAYAGVWFELGEVEAPFDPSSFTHIELEIWGEGSPPHLKVDRFVDGASMEGKEHPWPAGPLPASRELVRIPLSALTDVTAETQVHQLVLVYPHDSSGANGTLWIDNLALLSDDDLDEMPQWWEDIHGLKAPEEDPDGDLVTNLEEFRRGTNPHRCDSDFDGLPDGWELERGLDPRDGTGPHGAAGDPDDNGSTNGDDYAAVEPAGYCAPSPPYLELVDRRFRVEVEWRDFRGNHGSGQVVPFRSGDSGLFWFFDADNWEMLVKVLDGCGLNDRFWVFAAATTNVEYTLRVTDTATGSVSEYLNPLGTAAAPITDTDAFATCGNGAQAGDAPSVAPTPHSVVANDHAAGTDHAPTSADGTPVTLCTPTPWNLCLNRNRFEVEVDWQTAKGDSGRGQVVPLGSGDSGLFWFFRHDNWEMLVKVLDGCAVNGNFWVLAAATTDLDYTLSVRNVASGQLKQYSNPPGLTAPAVVDTGAFVCR